MNLPVRSFATPFQIAQRRKMTSPRVTGPVDSPNWYRNNTTGANEARAQNQVLVTSAYSDAVAGNCSHRPRIQRGPLAEHQRLRCLLGLENGEAGAGPAQDAGQSGWIRRPGGSGSPNLGGSAGRREQRSRQDARGPFSSAVRRGFCPRRARFCGPCARLCDPCREIGAVRTGGRPIRRGRQADDLARQHNRAKQRTDDPNPVHARHYPGCPLGRKESCSA